MSPEDLEAQLQSDERGKCAHRPGGARGARPERALNVSPCLVKQEGTDTVRECLWWQRDG